MTSDIDALEANAWSLYAALGTGPGGNVVNTPSRLLLETPVRQPPYNMLLRFYDEGDRSVDEQVATVVQRLTSRDVTAAWLVHPTTDPGVAGALRRCGWAHAETLYGMAAEIADLNLRPRASLDPGVAIIAATPDDTDLWVELVSMRYGIPTQDAGYLREVYSRNIGTTTRVWVATFDGVALSKVAVHTSDGIAGIYGVVTAPQGRGRGLATALMVRALTSMQDSGVKRSVLHSTPMAHTIYQGLGYRDVATFEVWAAPGTVHL